MFIQELVDDPVRYLSTVIVVMLSVVLHELGHGVAAYWEGDTTGRDQGHFTLNPMVHMGGFSLVMLFVFGLTWGSMPVDSARFRHGRMGDALVSFAGPAVNLVLMVLFSLVGVLWSTSASSVTANPILQENLQQFFLLGAILNAGLFLLNLVPLPPLDGYTVATALSAGFRRAAPFIERNGMGLFLLLFFFGAGVIFRVASVFAVLTIGAFDALLT